MKNYRTVGLKALATTALALCCAASARAQEYQLGLTPLGTKVHDSVAVKLFELSFGDQCPALASVADRLQSGGMIAPFAYDWAMYIPSPAKDGTWRLCQARMPKRDNLFGPPDPAGAAERKRFNQFLDQHHDAVMDPCTSADFGQPGDFIYVKNGLSPSALPAPLDRISPDILSPDVVESVIQHNSDKTMVVILRSPFDEDGKVQKIYRQIARQLEPGTEKLDIPMYPTCNGSPD